MGLTENKLDVFSLFPLGVGVLLLVLPIMFFRYKPNYLIFSRKAQEIYYVKTPKSIIRFKWKDVIGEHHKIVTFSGSSVLRSEVLHITGISQYGDNKPTPTHILIATLDENMTKEFWAYLQAYMSNGAKGLEEPSIDRIDGSFFTVAKRETKQILYTSLIDFMTIIFSPKSDLSFILRVFLFPFLPLAIFVYYVIYWPAQIATTFVNSTRTRTPYPEDLLPYISDNKDCYGKEIGGRNRASATTKT